MFIFYAECYKCLRFGLKGAEKIIIRPEKKTQMVLGTNGSGKSSLLKFIMTVIPPDKSHFQVGGHKIVKVRHNGSIYTISTFYEKSAPKHSFICDKEELNNGGTGSVQKELIRQHFGITQEIHDLITGIEQFTHMSPLRRRDWITKLSATDFSYVLEFFNRVRKGARDADAIMRNSQDRLAGESVKLLSPDEEASLIQRSQEFHEDLNLLIQERSRMDRGEQDVVRELRHKHEELEDRIRQFLKNSRFEFVGPYEIHSVEDAYKISNDLRQKLTEHEAVLSELGSRYADLDAKMQEIRTISGMDERYVRQELANVNHEIEELRCSLATGLAPESLLLSRNALVDAENLRMELMHVMPAHAERYNQENASSVRQTLEQLMPKREVLMTRISNIEGRLEHIRACDEVHCPNCHSNFKPGVGDSEAESLQAGLLRDQAELKQVDERLHELQTYLGEWRTYHGHLQEIQALRTRNRELAPLWAYIDQQGGVGQGSTLAAPILDFVGDVKTAWKISELTQRAAVLKDSIDRFEKLTGGGREIADQHIAVQARISETTRAINGVQDELALIDDYLRKNERMDTIYRDLRNDVLHLNRLKDELVEVIRQTHIQESISQTQSSLAMINNTLSEQQSQQWLVNDLRKELERSAAEKEVYKMMEEVLSPKDGLIAEQICLFINIIISKVNEVIARVWGFNMGLLPVSLDDGDMDFKFPIYSGSEDNVTEDISKGSDSMVEIVNQAFRLTAYKMLGLENFPLYIDELGRGFDPVHRANLVFAIKDMIEDPMYSQVFIISHYIDGQNSYPNSEIIVTDDSHIEMQREYNQHVVFE